MKIPKAQVADWHHLCDDDTDTDSENDLVWSDVTPTSTVTTPSRLTFDPRCLERFTNHSSNKLQQSSPRPP
ncbi:hypothetical protein J6590_026941 [Homalodisca vitripennis]|nr:hypothetical protein J6590_026941 [Homalodisca vitripennis]